MAGFVVMDSMPKLVIFDLDNTVYDFVSAYGGSLHAMARQIDEQIGDGKENSGIDKLARVFSTYNTVEYWPEGSPFPDLDQTSWCELRCEFKRQLKLNLKFYDGITAFLKLMKDQGIIVAAASNAPLGCAVSRLSHGCCLEYFDSLIAWGGGRLGRFSHRMWMSDRDYEASVSLSNCDITSVVSKDLKPSITMYKVLACKYATEISDVTVIGDSISRDLFPMNLMGGRTVHAEYGCMYKNEYSNILDRVTPWINPRQREISFSVDSKVLRDPLKMITEMKS